MQRAHEIIKQRRYAVILEEPERIVVYGTYNNRKRAELEGDRATVYAGSFDKLIEAGCLWSPIYDPDHFLIFGIKHSFWLCIPIGDFRMLVIELLEGASIDEYIVIRSNYRKAIEPKTYEEPFVCCN